MTANSALHFFVLDLASAATSRAVSLNRVFPQPDNEKNDVNKYPNPKNHTFGSGVQYGFGILASRKDGSI